MARALQMVSNDIAGYVARQPRIAIGGTGLATIMLLQVTAMLAGWSLA